MSDQNKSDNASSQLPGIAVIALLLGTFVLKDTAFESSRPAMPDAEKTSTEDVRSRLWQDPFEAVKLHRKKYPDTAGKKKNIVIDKDNPDFAYQLDKTPQRICNTEKSHAAHSIEELRCQIQRDVNSNDDNTADLHVLAVMVPGGPYAEDEEWRLRSRYALVSGLAAADYIPIDPEHIGYIDFLQACKKGAYTKEKIKFCDWPAYMPYEWFKLGILSGSNKSSNNDQNKPSRLLVLWLDNDSFARNRDPLKMLNRLKDGITPGDNEKSSDKELIRTSFNVIGPHNSNTLKIMYEEIHEIANTCIEEPKTKKECNYHDYRHLLNSLIFSPTATIDTATIKEKIKLKPEPYKYKEKNFKWLEDRVIRTISTNKDLTNTLLCELIFRGVKPFKATDKFFANNCALSKHGNPPSEKKNHDIVLIGELDTVYSRRLMGSFLNEINKHDRSLSQIHAFSYLRGIDGTNPEQTSSNTDSKKEGADAHDPYKDKDKTNQQLRRPTGTNQYDYLRRLADQIKQLHKENIDKGGVGIKAIGILGSDTYDKLLILQALHKKFPQTLFFSTDLDVRLLHPSDLKWTRNLIVASPFGLQLHKDLQQKTSVFRDSYQTALYLATLLATDCRQGHNQCNNQTLNKIFTQKKSERNLQPYNLIEDKLANNPRIFEIGNYSAVDLSHTAGENIHSEPETFTHEIDWSRTGHLFFPFLLILLFLLYTVPRNVGKIIIVIFSGVFGVMVFYLALQKVGIAETFSFTDGTSTWPAIAIRLFTFFSAISFFILLLYQLKNSNKKIKDEYFDPPLSDETKIIEKNQ